MNNPEKGNSPPAKGKSLLERILLSPYLSAALIVFGLAFRLAGFPFVSADMKGFLFDWYQTIASQGLIQALNGNISNYTPPYLYLLGLATLTKSFLQPVVGIKMISVVFDVYSAFIVYKIVQVLHPRDRLPLLAGSLYLLLPTLALNSSYWGQADSIYFAFVLTSLFFLLKERPGWSMLFFGIALTVKLQAVFLAPFLVVLTFRKKMSWWLYLIVPAVYAVLAAPAALAGRPWMELLTIYLGQAGSTNLISRNAANPYSFVPPSGQVHIFSRVFNLPPDLARLVLVPAAVLILVWIFLSVRRVRLERPGQLLLSALASVALLPFILPYMHDRYFYPADGISFLAAFFVPGLWYLPILFQASSLLVYNNYLFGGSPFNLPVATGINLVALVIVLWNQLAAARNQVLEGSTRVQS